MQNLIECKGLTKRYGNVCALDKVDLEIPAGGGIVGLLGPNGSGKTTLIKLLTGLLQPTEGSVRICDKPVGVETKAVVSYLSDFYSLIESYTVREELDYYADFFADFDRCKAETMLRDLGITDNLKVKTLSKGTKEKLALILTLSRNAKLYIFDEPIAGVDPAAREYVLNTILSNRSEDSTILLSTHLISEIEQYFDHVIFLRQGRVILSGKADDVRAEHGQSIDALFREVFKWMC
ncbi:MAG: ABC transporter ATP-binding protein [Clostridiales bacterium]|nr:ABC transporter ATP-binding protein [Clostridiales bacterium]